MIEINLLLLPTASMVMRFVVVSVTISFHISLFWAHFFFYFTVQNSEHSLSFQKLILKKCLSKLCDTKNSLYTFKFDSCFSHGKQTLCCCDKYDRRKKTQRKRNHDINIILWMRVSYDKQLLFWKYYVAAVSTALCWLYHFNGAAFSSAIPRCGRK